MHLALKYLVGVEARQVLDGLGWKVQVAYTHDIQDRRMCIEVRAGGAI